MRERSFSKLGVPQLKTASQLVSVETQTYLHGTEAQVEQIHQAFGQQLSVLNNLLRAGPRESTVFYARLSNYNAFLVALTDHFPLRAGSEPAAPRRDAHSWTSAKRT